MILLFLLKKTIIIKTGWKYHQSEEDVSHSNKSNMVLFENLKKFIKFSINLLICLANGTKN